MQRVTDTKRAATLSSGRLSDALEMFPLAVLALDTTGNALAVNGGWLELSGQSDVEALGVGWQDRLGGDEGADVLASVRAMGPDGERSELDLVIDTVHGPRWTRWWVDRRCISGRDVVVAAVADVHSDHVRHRDLYDLATHDSLTGLYNRTYFAESVKQALARSRRTGETVGVAYIDIDGLKAVNDTAGHSAGDALISAAAERILACSRGADIVARVGGDEFAVLCANVNGRSDLDTFCERLRKALTAENVDLDDAGPLELRASIGVAVAEPGVGSAEDLLARADQGMYADKRARQRPSVLEVDGEIISPSQLVIELRDTMRRIEEIIGTEE